MFQDLTKEGTDHSIPMTKEILTRYKCSREEMEETGYLVPMMREHESCTCRIYRKKETHCYAWVMKQQNYVSYFIRDLVSTREELGLKCLWEARAILGNHINSLYEMRMVS